MLLTNGQRLGAYTVDRLLGTGGMAEVYRATHQTLERDVAVKVIKPSLNADPTFPLRFLREAKAVAKLSHPNIITVFDFGEQGELAYLVMEIANGGTLRERAPQLHTLREAVEALAALGSALAYAHGRGIVHRDLKPINVLIGESHRLLLADFGLARVAAESIDLELTEAGLTLGTPLYMSPEQALGEAVDQRADIYSFGILAFELIAGRLPFSGNTAYALIQQHLRTPMPSINTVLPAAPAALDRALQRATAKAPEDRYDHVDAFVEDLRQAAGQAPDLPVGASAALGAAGAPPAPAPRPAVPAPQPQAPAEVDLNATLLQPPPADTVGTFIARSPEAQAPPRVSPGAEGPGFHSVRTSAAEGLPAGQRAAYSPPPSDLGSTMPVPQGAWPEEPFHRVKRRPSSFRAPQWFIIGAVLAVALFVNAIGLWLARAGRGAAVGTVAESITTGIFAHLGWWKSGLTLVALIFATVAALTMRHVAVENHQMSLKRTRQLRRIHRLAGYSAVTLAFAVGLMTCVGIFGFGHSTFRQVYHSALGSALLIVIIVKIAIVRYYPAQRRYLKWLGQGLLVLFVLVFLSSAVPYAYQQFNGTKAKSNNPNNPYGGGGYGAPYSIKSSYGIP